jgi:hypothetical protein
LKQWGQQCDLQIMKKKGLWNKMNQMATLSLQRQLDLEKNHQGLEGET